MAIIIVVCKDWSTDIDQHVFVLIAQILFPRSGTSIIMYD